MLFVDPNTTPKKSSPPIHLDVETRVRNWTVTRVLEPTAGGMQEAVAEDAQGTPVLLRVPGDTDAIERVFAEAALAKRHRHWGIVHTIGVVDHQGWPVQVIEHVDGLSLDHVSMLAGSLAPEAVCRIGWQIAMILAELHREPGGHHGALSGERILVDAAGHVRLADLGRARPEQLFRLLSPERRASGGVGSPEDDLYALGGTLIEAALGRSLERTIGWIDTRALGGVLPERLIDALEALVAPSGKRLKNASAVMRVFETLEPMLGDGSVRLKKAVEYARLGAAIGSAAAKERPDVDDARTLPPSKTTHASPFEPFDETPDELALTDPGAPAPVAPFVPFSDRSSPAAVALESTPSAEAMPLAAIAPIAADAAPDEVTNPSDPALDARAQSFYARHSAEPVTETQVEAPVAPAPRAAAAPIATSVDEDELAPPKKKWPLFSRMIAWAFVGLLAVNVLAAVWVLAEPPLSQAFGTQLPKLPGSDITLDSMAQQALGSLVAGASDPSFALPLDGAALDGAALDGALPDAPSDEAPVAALADALADAPPAPGELALSDKEQQEFAAALAALAAELEKAQPGLAASAPALAEPAGGALAFEEPALAAAASYNGRPIGMPKRKAAKKPTAAVAPAAPLDEKPTKLAKPEKPAKAEAKAEKVVKAERPEKATKPGKAAATEAAAPGVPVKLVVEAPAAMRAQAEAGLRNCNLKAPVNGVVRVSPAGTVRSVSTDPLSPCVAKVLKQTLGGFEEDAPFEVNPR